MGSINTKLSFNNINDSAMNKILDNNNSAAFSIFILPENFHRDIL